MLNVRTIINLIRVVATACFNPMYKDQSTGIS